MFTRHRAQSRSVFVTDLIVVCAVALALYWATDAFGLFQAIHTRLAQYDTWQHGVFVVLIFLSVGISVLSLRHWRVTVQLLQDRERAQADLMIAKEHALAANRAKSEFLADVSHEIRTPMKGIVRTIERTLDTELTSRQRESLQQVNASCCSLLQLVNDILEVSKAEVGKLELVSSQFALPSMLTETVKSFSVRAGDKGVELACRIAPSVPDDVIGDPLRLRQVLVNLLGNAVKFTEHGKVTVAVECDSRTVEEVRLHFTVQDTGIGIPPRLQESILAILTQSEGSPPRRFGGIGLGLAIAARLVGLMGGQLWVESQCGKGSTFHFTAALRTPSGAAVTGSQASDILAPLTSVPDAREAANDVADEITASAPGKDEHLVGAASAAQEALSAQVSPGPSPADEAEVFNLDALRARVDLNLDRVAELIEVYLDNSPRLLDEIESALAARNCEKLSRAAQTLHGVLTGMCAHASAAAAQQLGSADMTGDSMEAEEEFWALKIELRRLRLALSEVTGEIPV